MLVLCEGLEKVDQELHASETEFYKVRNINISFYIYLKWNFMLLIEDISFVIYLREHSSLSCWTQ